MTIAFLNEPSRRLRAGLRRRRDSGSGFTLIELMIVVAIIAIIAAVAYPAYTDSVIKGKRGQGRAALLDLMQQEERYMTQAGSYVQWTSSSATSASVNGGTVSPVPFKMFSGDNPSSAAYQLYAKTCPVTPVPALNECIVVYAAPNFSDPSVGVLTLQSTGVKSCYTDTTLTTQQPSSAPCW